MLEGRIIKAAVTGEKGVALVISLMITVLLTIVGFTVVYLSKTESDIAGNERISVAAQYAAEAGLAEAVNDFNTHLENLDITGKINLKTGPPYNFSGVTAAQLTAVSSQIGKTLRTLTVGDYTVRTTIGYKINGGSVVADTLTYPVEMFSNKFYTADLAKAPPPGVAYPVFVITATATNGQYNSIVEEEITVTTLDLKSATRGGLTANSAVDLTGNITISGMDHDENGVALADQSTAVPAVNTQAVADGTVVPINAGGASATENAAGQDNVTDAPEAPLDYIYKAVGLDSDSDFNDMVAGNTYGAGAEPTAAQLAEGGVFYIQHGYAGRPTGNGLLIVHNPLFIPGQWRISNPASQSYAPPGSAKYDALTEAEKTLYDVRLDTSKAGLGYDAAYKATCAPANAGNLNGGTFKGVVICDQIDKINGNINIYGALISLTSMNVNNIGAGTANIFFSSEAISKYVTNAHATLNRKLSWRKKTSYE